MSDDPLPCEDKISFDSQKEADVASLVADWQHGASVKSYKCKYCKLWHLASNFE